MNVKCVCQHEYQDRIYGKGIRATTPINSSKAKNNGKVGLARCTVCGREHKVHEE